MCVYSAGRGIQLTQACNARNEIVIRILEESYDNYEFSNV